MKAIPILFSTPMVQAILDGRKSQTRRIIDPQPMLHNEIIKLPMEIDQYGKEMEQWMKKGYKSIVTSGPASGYVIPKCRYGQPGDVLWVRETWAKNYDGTFDYKAGYPFTSPQGGWKPNIHMPKAACRIFLEVKAIQVERLQDISNMNAMNEGIECLDHGVHWKNYLSDEISCFLNPKHSFESLWKSINGPESWDSNPWVWVIDFKRIEKPTNWPSL